MEGDRGGGHESTATHPTDPGWTFTTTALTDGVHSFTVTSTDTAGNVSAAATLNVTIDTVAPNAPVITGNAIVNNNQVAAHRYRRGRQHGQAVRRHHRARHTHRECQRRLELHHRRAAGRRAHVHGCGGGQGGQHRCRVAGCHVCDRSDCHRSERRDQLTAVGSNFFFYDAAGSGPSLKFGGVAVRAGQFGGWTPIGVEQTANGYQVAWKSGSDYTFWNTDSNGNYVSGLGVLSAISSTVTSAENAFHQDLNGDGVIGVQAVVNTGTVIEANGATKLTAVGSNFFFYDGAGSGPSLKFGGVAVTAGQFGGWTPIGVEQTANGYQVAWKTGSDYTFWNTDSNGNYVSGLGVLSAISSTVTSAENAFHQDLNGDGVIGVQAVVNTGTVIEANGAAKLTAVGSNFFFYDGAGSGPSLKFGGVDVTAGQFGGWTPIGVEQTANGYQVAWKPAATIRFGIPTVTATMFRVLAFVSDQLDGHIGRDAFHQDLNNDGTIGSAAPLAGNAMSGAAGTNTTTSIAANEIIHGNGGNNSFVFAGNFVNNTLADVQTASDVFELNHNVSEDNALAGHAAQTGADGVLAATRRIRSR